MKAKLKRKFWDYAFLRYCGLLLGLVRAQHVNYKSQCERNVKWVIPKIPEVHPSLSVLLVVFCSLFFFICYFIFCLFFFFSLIRWLVYKAYTACLLHNISEYNAQFYLIGGRLPSAPPYHHHDCLCGKGEPRSPDRHPSTMPIRFVVAPLVAPLKDNPGRGWGRRCREWTEKDPGEELNTSAPCTVDPLGH